MKQPQNEDQTKKQDTWERQKVSDSGDKGQLYSQLCSEEPAGDGPKANKAASGCPLYTPSRICGAFGVGPGQSIGGVGVGGSLPSLGELSLPLS